MKKFISIMLCAVLMLGIATAGGTSAGTSTSHGCDYESHSHSVSSGGRSVSTNKELYIGQGHGWSISNSGTEKGCSYSLFRFTNKKVTLSWNFNQLNVNFIKYKIYRSTDGGNFQLLTTTTGSSYSDTTAVSGKIYNYKIVITVLGKTSKSFTTGYIYFV